LVTLLGGAFFWYLRNRGAVGTIEDMADLAQEARNAPRRIKFKRTANIHSVELCKHTDELVAGFSMAYLEASGLPTQDEQQACTAALAREFTVTLNEAEELATYGRWLVNECGTPQQAVDRISKRLYKLDPQNSFPHVLNVINEISSVSGQISAGQTQALDQLKKAFRIQ
jgi:hypothetical protein